ncbi:major facilitator superfamily domain-containing protein [Melampsora americana]|nr:major facilitator superfamily domain-containing protein [Melampsora americana]
MSSQYPLHDSRHPMHEPMRQKVVRKIDLNIIPSVTLLYFACFIDRSNIGNAKAAGLTRDLGLEGIQFNIALNMFFITYALVEIPSNLLLRKVGAKTWLPFLVFGWGMVTFLSAFMKNFSELIVVRLFLGVFEGGLLPGMVLYLSTIYKAEELQLRLGLSFAGAALSGGCGGFIAFGIQKNMDGLYGRSAWSWIFLLEGLGTILVAFCGWYFLCSDVGTASFLDEDEQMFAVNRLREPCSMSRLSPQLNPRADEKDSLNASDLSLPCVVEQGAYHVPEPFEWAEVKRGFLEPQVWLIGIAIICMTIPMLSLGFFLPSLVYEMGHTGAQAQLYSSYPYISAAVFVLLGSVLADKLRMRGPIVLASTPITIAGYMLLSLADANQTRYASFFLITAGTFTSIPCLMCIIPINTAGITKRATCIGVGAMLSSVAGLISPFVYIEGVPEVVGHKISLGLVCGAWLFTAANVVHCYRENLHRKSGQKDHLMDEYLVKFTAGETQAPIGDRDPSFLFTL